MNPQIQYNDKYVRLKVTYKMINLVARGYMTELLILTLTSLFSVPKVTEDISMVFNTTVRVLNDSFWYRFLM